MGDGWLGSVPILQDFAQVADPSSYTPLPGDWWVGVSDVVNSTGAIEDGRYKAVNLAGAATISAVSNALGGALPVFAFAGDGAHFAVPPDQAAIAAEALRRVAFWAERDLGLSLRVGSVAVDEVRAAGSDVAVAFWRASDDVRYAMFTGGGLAWVERQLKEGAIRNPPTGMEQEPDLTGLSCQWGPIASRRGMIASLIVKPLPDASRERFAAIVADVVGLLEGAGSLNPVPVQGPDVGWPSAAAGLQSRIARNGQSLFRRRLNLRLINGASWLVFKLGLRIGGFDPNRYRREIAANTDYRKFDDGLMMTVDCSTETIARLRGLLDTAKREGILRYGLHMQDSALMTCVVPSATTSTHMHFVDGAAGGYALAARQMREDGDP